MGAKLKAVAVKVTALLMSARGLGHKGQISNMTLAHKSKRETKQVTVLHAQSSVQ